MKAWTVEVEETLRQKVQPNRIVRMGGLGGDLAAIEASLLDPLDFAAAAQAKARQLGLEVGSVVQVSADPWRANGMTGWRQCDETRNMRIVRVLAVVRQTTADVTPTEQAMLALEVAPQ